MSDTPTLLTDGVGFLLVKSESQVVDWRDTEEVTAKHYSECRTMAKALLPEAKILTIESHTFRDEDKKEHYFVDVIQYGPPALTVHNDYADSLRSDGTMITQSFAEIIAHDRAKYMAFSFN